LSTQTKEAIKTATKNYELVNEAYLEGDATADSTFKRLVSSQRK
jgi:hypothetical protein